MTGFRARFRLTTWFLLVCAAPAMAAEDPRFRQLTSEDGLSDESVTSILVDSRGFVWIGTSYGLNRYDGYDFRVYQHANGDSSTVSGHWIRDLAEDDQGRVWVGTDKGLCFYDRTSDRFHRLNTADRRGHVVRVMADREGGLWVGRTGDVLRIEYDGSGALDVKEEILSRDLPGQSSWLVHAFLEDTDGSVWIGLEEGLARWDRATGAVVAIPFPERSGKAHGALALAQDADGRILVGSEGGVFRVNADRSSLDRLTTSDDAITAVFVDSEDGQWLGTRSRGMMYLAADSGMSRRLLHSRSDPFSIGRGTITDIITDRAGQFWIGTYGGGVSLLARGVPRMAAYVHEPGRPASLSTDPVFSTLRDRDGTLWVGTALGLNRIEGGVVRRVYRATGAEQSISHDVVRALLEDSSGRLWVGTDGGLNLLDGETDEVLVYQSDPDDPETLLDNVIRCLYEDSAGRFWVGTNGGGLHLMDRDTGRFRRFFDVRSPIHAIRCIRSIAEDADGKLWISTTTGVIRLNPDIDEAPRRYKATLPSHSIYGVIPAEAGVWILTAGGLVLLNEEADRHQTFTVRDGLPTNTLYAARRDRDGRLWISSDRGIFRVTPAHSDEGVDIRVWALGRAEGLVGMEFNSGASFADTNGTLYFGGMSGLNALMPARMTGGNTTRPPLVFTEMEYTAAVDGVQTTRPVPGIAERSRVRLPHSTTHVRVSFAALDFVDPSRNQYAYWLEGLEKDWILLRNQRTLNLSLSPGRYRLHVQGANNQGVWNREGRSLGIEVVTPYWQEAWFIGGIALVVAGAVLGGHRVRTRVIRRRNAELDRLVQELEDRNSELERFTYTVSHDLKSPLITIKGFASLLKRDVAEPARFESDVDRIEEAAGQMLALLDDLLELSRVGRLVNPPETVALRDIVTEAEQRVNGRALENRAEIAVADDLPVVSVDRKRMEEVFQNLLDNALKFSGPGARVRVGVLPGSEPPVVFVQDNGPGIDPKYRDKVFGLFERLDPHTEGTGIGLALVKRIVEIHGGDIWVEDADGGGSRFCLRLPSVQGVGKP